MISAVMQNLHDWDTVLCLQIFSMNGRRTLDRIMIAASRLGDGYLYPVIGLVVFLLNRTAAMMFLPAALIAFAIEIPLYKIIKQKIRRARPCNMISEIKNLISFPDEFSFPSGHTAAAFLMAALLSAFFPAFIVPAYLIAMVIGVSRIYNGVHYPGDVLVGSLIGLVSAKIGLLIIG
ncbi:phosphatase PAP2 family protein [bacterium]|nr:phosphatase PAP2 family protein [bacterium]